MIKLAGLEIELINTGRELFFIGWLDRFFCPQSRLFRKLLRCCTTGVRMNGPFSHSSSEHHHNLYLIKCKKPNLKRKKHDSRKKM